MVCLGADVFIVKRFYNSKKVNDGKNCAFLNHIRDDLRSLHNNAVKCYDTLLNQSQHIHNFINVQSLEEK